MLGSTQNYITLTESQSFHVHLLPSQVVEDLDSHINCIVKHIYFRGQENVLVSDLHNVLLEEIIKAEAKI